MGLLDGFYYLIVVENFSKWLDVLWCRDPPTEVKINLLHKLFTRFGVAECLVSDNGTQFTSGYFKDFCETFKINHITIVPYIPSSNGQAEPLVDTLKRAPKKPRGIPTGKSLQHFLQVYRITHNNNNTPSSLPTAEVISTRKIRFVFDKQVPKQTKIRMNTVPKKKNKKKQKQKTLPNRRESFFFLIFPDNKSFWEMSTIEK